MQYRDAYAFFFFLIFLMIIFNYKEYTERLKVEIPEVKTPKMSPLLSGVSRILPLNRSLTLAESDRVAKCSSGFDSTQGSQTAVLNDDILSKSYGYLTTQSFVVSLGGRDLGRTVELIGQYKPRVHIVLEPITSYYNTLVEKFKDNPKVAVYNFGLSFRDDIYKMKLLNGDSQVVKVVNARDFFQKLGIGFFDVDLLTINCMGCEYDVLDVLLSSTLIYHIKNIQFHTSHKPGNHDQVRRYCQYQELLKYTHHTLHQQKYIWEIWTRNDQK